MKPPTTNQYAALRSVGSPGAAYVHPTSRSIKSCMRRGWLAAADERRSPGHMVRITSTGLRALADALELYGYPEACP